MFISTGATRGTVNLYGGTYVKSDACTTGAVVAIGDSGGKVNVYEQAVVLGDKTGYSVYVDAATRAPAKFGVHGGTVADGESIEPGSDITVTLSFKGESTPVICDGNAKHCLEDGIYRLTVPGGGWCVLKLILEAI